jgi:hypothetical protein
VICLSDSYDKKDASTTSADPEPQEAPTGAPGSAPSPPGPVEASPPDEGEPGDDAPGEALDECGMDCPKCGGDSTLLAVGSRPLEAGDASDVRCSACGWSDAYLERMASGVLALQPGPRPPPGRGTAPDPEAIAAYEAKLEARRERLLAAADKADRASQAAYERNRRIADMIPLGQPVLVGHHSEGRHRRDLKRMDDAMRRTVEEGQRAEELRSRAAAVGSGGISSDDPEAIRKLRAELADLEALQERQKAANKAVRSKDPRAALAAQGVKPEYIEALLTPDFAGRIGFPSYVFSNRNGNMRRIRQRIKDLERRAAQAPAPERMVAGVRVVDNAELNRLQLYFPGKPDQETRSKLKSYGFRWSPTLGCWQAFRSSRATWAAGAVLGMDLFAAPAAESASSGAEGARGTKGGA